MVSRELERECIVVFDEAHNIDNVCIEDMSVNIRRQTLDSAARNVQALGRAVDRAKATDADRLRRADTPRGHPRGHTSRSCAGGGLP